MSSVVGRAACVVIWRWTLLASLETWGVQLNNHSHLIGFLGNEDTPFLFLEAFGWRGLRSFVVARGVYGRSLLPSRRMFFFDIGRRGTVHDLSGFRFLRRLGLFHFW